MSKNATIAIIVAAGRGSRAGPGGPKQYRTLAGKAILARTVSAFTGHPGIDAVRVIIHRDDDALYANAVPHDPKLLAPVHGGSERQDSVRLGLESLTKERPDIVLIHDAARPFVDAGSIDRVLCAIAPNTGAIAALPVFDTIKKEREKEGDPAAFIKTTIPREKLWRAQTPQGFLFAEILSAHRQCVGKRLTDDASVAENAGLAVALVAGSPDNMKITQADDFGMAQTLLNRKQGNENAMNEFRTGHGYDVHAFTTGRNVTLCGVTIPYSASLMGHSDADVGMHALTDAILGAIGAGDIGDHFPPSDPQWKGVASHVFLTKARDLVATRHGSIVHCDVTLICEEPKIGPHRDEMKSALGRILKMENHRISVKATTTEKLGFTGRGEGIAAMATATVRLPSGED